MSEGEPLPVEVFSLAQFVAEEMDERGWTSLDVAARMPGDFGINAFMVDMLLAVQGQPHERVLIDEKLCTPLEDAFGVSRGFFLRLNAGWDLYPEKRVAFEAPEDLFSGASIRP